jgi:hypothetical protein
VKEKENTVKAGAPEKANYAMLLTQSRSTADPYTEQKSIALVARTKSPSLQPNPDDINDYYQNTATPDETAAMRAELKTQLKLLKGP